MSFLLDTNIILTYLRRSQFRDKFETILNLFNDKNILIVSAVTIGELKSIAIKNGWGQQKIDALVHLVKRLVVVDINVESILNRYAEIDAYSQGKHPSKPLPNSSRNMGKNDLWIAATASILEVPLITTDKDFEHLDEVFLELEHVKM